MNKTIRFDGERYEVAVPWKQGLFLEGVTAHFVSSLLGNIMPDLTRRLTHWELMQFQNTVKWISDAIRTYGK